MKKYSKQQFNTDISNALFKIKLRKDNQDMSEEDFAFMLFTIQSLMIKYDADATGIARHLKKFKTHRHAMDFKYSTKKVLPGPLVVNRNQNIPLTKNTKKE